jgi:hypothetical protein
MSLPESVLDIGLFNRMSRAHREERERGATGEWLGHRLFSFGVLEELGAES